LDEHDFRFSKEPIGMIASINNFSAPGETKGDGSQLVR
jgi:hypothetical protein